MRKFLSLLFFVTLLTNGFSQDGKERLKVFDNRTIPDDPNVLFYIHKNTNPNAVVYALKLDSDKKINPEEPIEVFWRRYQEDGRKKKLAWLEKTFAFDFKVKPVNGKENTYAFSLIAMKDKQLIATQNKKGEPLVFMTIAGKSALLEKLYIMVDDTKRIQSVLSIEIFGKDPKTGQLVYEKIVK
ncbi:MAG: DUF4833 domain-containing protein [Vicingaceae bacterium]|nr:DUF4833 domain-containing protein [Vicingaceae bacterium]